MSVPATYKLVRLALGLASHFASLALGLTGDFRCLALGFAGVQADRLLGGLRGLLYRILLALDRHH